MAGVPGGPEREEAVVARPTERPLSRPGEVGELYVRGPSLMRGYWGQSARTSEALVRTWTGKVDQAGLAGE